jgi:FKBP-type peptidyl-prolyl cis-trans isomerase FkpA
MRMKSASILLVSAIVLVSCSKYPGYKRLTPEIYYSLYQFDDPGVKPIPGDYVTIMLEYRTSFDSVIFSGIRKVRLFAPLDNSSVDHCFLKLNAGDSASFIIPAKKFFNNTLKRSLPEFIKEGDYLKINVKLIEIQSEKDFQIEKQLFLSWSSELSEYENNLLQKFLKEQKPGIQAKPEGFYMIPLKSGNGRKIKRGDHIWVNYEGKFLNGKFFDGTYRSREPVDFIYGTQFMLISGLEQALSYMSEGENAMVILPSGLAFGEKGDDFGIIPPYTSLIYTMELVKIE